MTEECDAFRNLPPEACQVEDGMIRHVVSIPTVAADPSARTDEEAVMQAFLTGTPVDPEVARRVQERGRLIRERAFRKHGLVDISVPSIRELRGPLP